ncbi:MAG: DUF1858 domain-containing protein [archaeon]|jgi:hybrid cluster-associated redox disulfide protein
MIRKEDSLGGVIEKYPEVIPVIARAGLHCVGCHLSANESVEAGCESHGLSGSEIQKLIEEMNKEVLEFEKKLKVEFTKGAVIELERRLNESGKKFVRVVQLFGGEFDFQASDEIEEGDVEIKPGSGVVILLDSRTEKFLRGLKIDYDKRVKDFVAIKVRSNPAKVRKK